MLQETQLTRGRPESLKLRLFRLFHFTLEHYTIPAKLYYVFQTVEIIQLISYSLHPSLGRLWDTTVLQQVLAYSDLSPLLRSQPITLILFLMLCKSAPIQICCSTCWPSF